MNKIFINQTQQQHSGKAGTIHPKGRTTTNKKTRNESPYTLSPYNRTQQKLCNKRKQQNTSNFMINSAEY
jgi:hypothetical protein